MAKQNGQQAVEKAPATSEEAAGLPQDEQTSATAAIAEEKKPETPEPSEKAEVPPKDMESSEKAEEKPEIPAPAETPAKPEADKKPKEPEEPEEKAAPGPKVFRVSNLHRASVTIFSRSGNPVVFNGEGIAEVCADDYHHLIQVPGYEGVE